MEKSESWQIDVESSRYPDFTPLFDEDICALVVRLQDQVIIYRSVRALSNHDSMYEHDLYQSWKYIQNKRPIRVLKLTTIVEHLFRSLHNDLMLDLVQPRFILL